MNKRDIVDIVAGLAIIVGILLCVFLGFVLCEIAHYNDSENYRDITVNWKMDSYIEKGISSHHAFYVGSTDNFMYEMSELSYMKMEEGKLYPIVREYETGLWQLVQ